MLILLVIHAVIAVLLVLLVLLQRSEGGLGGLAGGSSGGNAFMGARAAGDVLSRGTTILGVLFMGSSLFLAWLTAGSSAQQSVVDKVAAPAVQEQAMGEGAASSTPGTSALPLPDGTTPATQPAPAAPAPQALPQPE